MTETPAVSVLMPVYNGERFLGEALSSIQRQSFRDLEIVVVDDGSTDGTAAILDAAAASDPRIRILHQANAGHVRALNAGLQQVRGRYVARMDADDIARENRLEEQARFLNDHPDVAVVGTAATVIDARGVEGTSVRFPTEHGVLRWTMCFMSPIIHPTAMLRTDRLRATGGYDASMRHAEDYDLWLRLSRVGRLANIDAPLLLLRKHDANVSTQRPADERRHALGVARCAMEDLLGAPVSPEDVDRVWTIPPRDAREARQVAVLVARLYDAAARTAGLTRSERAAIRRDAARRLYDLSRPHITKRSLWSALVRAYALDLSLLTTRIRRRLASA